jgi:PEP-CTERM motif
MKRILLIALLLATPAFAATMRTFAIQGGNTLVPLNAGDPMALTTTFAGTPMQNTYPNALVFQTDLGPIGAGTITFTLSIGGQTLPTITETYNCVVLGGSGCSISADFTMPNIYHSTPGTLVVDVNGSSTTFDFTFHSAVPEPTSMVLLGTGLGAIVWRRLSGRATATSRSSQ